MPNHEELKKKSLILAIIRLSKCAFIYFSIPFMWFLQEMKKNPELARRIARRIDDKSDEEGPGNLSTAELFKSERRISIF